MANKLKPVIFKTGLCSSVYILKPSLRSVSTLHVLELQELICRSLYDDTDLAELLFAPDSLHVPVKTAKARGQYIRKYPKRMGNWLWVVLPEQGFGQDDKMTSRGHF